MGLTDELKDHIRQECGNPAVGIAPVDDLSTQEIEALQETNRLMAKYSPRYSAETPVLQPRDFLDNARAVIVLAFNFYFGRDRALPGNPPRGEIMNFYVNQDCLTYIVEKTEKVTAFLTERGHTAVSVSSGIPVKIMAARSALGRYGKNAVIQAGGMGSWIGLNMVMTDAPLDVDVPADGECGECTLCQEACPTGALDTPYQCDIERCLTLHMVNNKEDLPRDIREKAGTIIAHCNACLDACPKNRKLATQNDISEPEDLVYPEIAALVNMTEDRFQELYGGTFLEYIFDEKKYLQRNAAVALGNYGDPQYVPVLVDALVNQPEDIVRGHAAWALGRIGTREAREALEEQSKKEESDSVRAEIGEALKQ